MTQELSVKDKELKAHIENSMKSFDLSFEARGRRVLGLLPRDPRCVTCLSPFEGIGGTLVRMVLHKERSILNPLMCNSCEKLLKRTRYGTELEMSMLFADIRGSTSLAEHMNPSEFKELIDHFYSETTHILAHSYAMIDKLAGDEVSGYYLPGMVGKDFTRKSIEAALDMLRVTGHANPEGPWAPVGVGINTGEAYFGAVGSAGGLVELTALGDEVNVAARLASQAGTGEIVISESTAIKASVDTSNLEKRTLNLKGKSKPMDVWVLRVTKN